MEGPAAGFPEAVEAGPLVILGLTVEGPAAGFPGAVEAVDAVLMGVAEAPDAGC